MPLEEPRRSTHEARPDPRNEEVLVYVNGTLVPRSEATVSVFDSGFQIGDGVWEGIRLHRGRLLFLDRHLDRLFQGAAAIGLPLGMDREEVTSLLRKTVDANRMESGVHVRLMVTRGVKKTSSQDPRLVVSKPTVVVIAEYKEPAPRLRESGIRLFTSSVRRGSPDYLDPRLNCHSKLHEVVALLQAIEAGADEALMLDVNGFVATCNSTNFFVVRQGEVWTSTGRYCMNGITREAVLEICREHSILSREKDFSLTDVYDADEAFVTGTFGGLTPVVWVDGRTIGEGRPGSIFRRLAALYAERVEREVLEQR